MLNDFEQQVYNTHLRTSRKALNKPYTLRKKFDDLDATSTLHVQRIARVLKKFQHINIQEFFQAPYQIYGADERFDLKFYTSPRALKAHALWMQQEVNADPDSDVVLRRVIDALHHINDHCKQHRINTHSYTQHVTGAVPTFLLHLKQRKNHMYICIELPQAVNIIRQQDPEVMRFMFGPEFFNNLQTYTTRFLGSQRCKALVRQGLQRIDNNTKQQNN